MEITDMYKPKAFTEVKRNLYLLAKQMIDNGNREDGDILFDAYLYLADYRNFLDKLEDIVNAQRKEM